MYVSKYVYKKEYHKIYIHKNEFFDFDSISLYNELKEKFSIKKLSIYQVYEFYKLNKKLISEYILKFLVDPHIDKVYEHKKFFNPYLEFSSTIHNTRSYAITQCIKMISNNYNTVVKSKSLIELIGIESKEKFYHIKEHIKKYYTSYKLFFFTPFNNFNNNIEKNNFNKHNKKNNIIYSTNKIECIHNKYELSIELNDLKIIYKYFMKKKKRVPKELEIKILDSFWSDHCRHITFNTKLKNILFNGRYKNIYNDVYKKYIEDKKFIGESNVPLSLMDISLLPSKVLKKKGKLKNYIFSNENNASFIKVIVDIIDYNTTYKKITNNNSKKENLLIFFKNETHNFPTEINPFYGAYTCLGGAIRDILSGRAFVYQGLRLSGSSNPNGKIYKYKKLPQKKICLESAYGFSSYGNQIGLSTTHVQEIYHRGYKAKKMEIGMVVGAVPVDFVQSKIPKYGDIIILIGGYTGKDGIGGATDSSRSHEKQNIYNVTTTGNPLTERKIQRLFKKKEITSLIKKCNDVGAGGLAIALGEIHDSLTVNLDKVPTKNDEILTDLELSLSESQERIIVVISSCNKEKFLKLSNKENICSTPIGIITNNKKIILCYKNKEVFNIKSSFLNKKLNKKINKVIVESPKLLSPLEKNKLLIFNKKTFFKIISNINIASQKHLSEMFDSTVGGTTVLMPFGGKYQLTPVDGSVQKIPIHNGISNTASIVSWGYYPEMSNWNPFHGGIYAVIECIAKIVSMGGNYKNIYFSFQEYYQKLGKDPKKWGKPFSALLGAYYGQMMMEIACIGGKDSMSGTYKNINVPPTLVVFGITTESCYNIISPEFKKVGNKVYLYNHNIINNEIPDFISIKRVYKQIYNGIKCGKIVSAKIIKYGGISSAIALMSFGNKLGVNINYNKSLLSSNIGSIIIESSSFLSKDFIKIGKITNSKYLNFNDISINIDDAINKWKTPLESIFSPNGNN